MWGISRNTRRWWSLAEGEAIGYFPKDDAEEYAAERIAEFGEPDFAADPAAQPGRRLVVRPAPGPSALGV